MASKYDRISADLRRRIEKGEFAPGERMPSETALQAQYGVTLTTFRRALAQLEASGLIEKRHGIGTFVRQPRTRIRRTTERYAWEKRRALLPEHERRSTGATEHDTGLTVNELEFHAEYDTIQADEEIAAAFGITAGTRLLVRSYRTRQGGQGSPIALSTSYLVHDIVAKNPDLLDASHEPWPGGTHHQLSTVGIEVDHITDEVTARPPIPEEAEALGIDTGVSVLCLRKTSIDIEGRVVEIADILMAGDRTQLVYTTQLERWPARKGKRK